MPVAKSQVPATRAVEGTRQRSPRRDRPEGLANQPDEALENPVDKQYEASGAEAPRDRDLRPRLRRPATQLWGSVRLRAARVTSPLNASFLRTRSRDLTLADAATPENENGGGWATLPVANNMRTASTKRGQRRRPRSGQRACNALVNARESLIALTSAWLAVIEWSIHQRAQPCRRTGLPLSPRTWLRPMTPDRIRREQPCRPSGTAKMQYHNARFGNRGDAATTVLSGMIKPISQTPAQNLLPDVRSPV
jgi:hypothetical protein